jgi:DNA-directed RNA polymerase specialized sigma subunit
MTTEKYLSQAVRFERMIKNKFSEMTRYQDLITSVSVSTEGERVQSSGSKDKIGEFASRIIDMQNEIQALTVKRDMIINQIEGIENPDLYQVLYSKYVDGINLYEIKDVIHCSKTQVYRVHEKAIAEFEAKYGKKYLKIK